MLLVIGAGVKREMDGSTKLRLVLSPCVGDGPDSGLTMVQPSQLEDLFVKMRDGLAFSVDSSILKKIKCAHECRNTWTWEE